VIGELTASPPATTSPPTPSAHAVSPPVAREPGTPTFDKAQPTAPPSVNPEARSAPTIPPHEDGALRIAAALEQVLQANHAANENVDTPHPDGPAPQTLSPFTEAFETYIDQSKFTSLPSTIHPVQTPLTIDPRLTEEELQNIAGGGSDTLRTHTPPPTNFHPFPDHRAEGGNRIDEDMVQDYPPRPEDDIFMQSPRCSPTPISDTSGLGLRTRENPPESDSSELSDDDSDEDSESDRDGRKEEDDGDMMSDHPQRKPAKEDVESEDEDEDVHMSDHCQENWAKEDGNDDNDAAHMSKDPQGNLEKGKSVSSNKCPSATPSSEPSKSPICLQSRSSVPPKSNSPNHPKSKTSGPSPPEPIEVSSEGDSEGEPEVTPPLFNAKPAKSRKACRSVAKTPAPPEPIPGTKFIIKSTLQGTLHSSIQGPITMLEMKVTPVV